METLILLRHAKAVRDHEAPSDRARRLTGRGRRDAASAGAALAAAGFRPDFALISPALRTRETAHLALLDFAPIDARVDEALYLSEPETIWAAAQACGGAQVVVIAHNPGLHSLAAHLVAQAHDRSKAARALAEGVPTAAFAAFAIDGETYAAPGARLIAAWRPERGDD
ncbi:MAG: histidine phosphatase family protein [Hyphomonadaceae bacterium]